MIENEGSSNQEILEEEKKFRLKVSTKASIAFAIIIFVTTIIRSIVLPLPLNMLMISLMSATVLIIITRFAKEKINPYIYSNFIIAVLGTITFYFCFSSNGVFTPAISVATVLPLLGILSGGKKSTYFGIIVFCFIIISITYLHLNHVIGPRSINELNIIIPIFPIILTGVMLVSLSFGLILEKYRSDKEKVISDITDQLYQYSKNVTLGRLSGGVAHEINNPLSIISLSKEKISRALRSSEIDKQLIMNELDRIERYIARSKSITESLILYSKGSVEMPLEKIILSQVIDSAISLSLDYPQKNKINIFFEKEGHQVVYSNYFLLTQIIHRLIENSIEAPCKENEKKIYIQVNESSSKRTIISVIDNGIGIPKEAVDKIFDPFFSTKNIGEGKGMGLSECLSMIKSIKGKIYLDRSSPETCFCIELPRTE